MVGKLWVALMAVLAACLGGCAPERVTTDDTVLRSDSSGVEVITNLTNTDALPVDSLGDEPVVAIASERQGGVVFDRINGLAVLANGEIAAGSHGTKAVCIFGESGHLRLTLGRPGDGPGEFRGIAGVFVIPPDSIAVFDNWLGRVTVFATDGRFGRTIDVRRFLPPAAGADLYPTSSGLALVGIASVAGRREQSIYRDSAASYLLSLEGDSVGYYGRFPGVDVMYADRLFGPLPFGAYLTSGVRDDRLLIGTGDEPELREYSLAAGLMRLIRWPDHDRQVSQARMDQFVEFRISGMSEDERAAFGATVRDLPHAPIAPAYYQLVVSSDGTLWLGDYPGPELIGPTPPVRSRTWTLFRSDGVRVRRIVGPPGFNLEAVRDGLAYGVHTDELGIQSIQVYQVPPN